MDRPSSVKESTRRGNKKSEKTYNSLLNLPSNAFHIFSEDILVYSIAVSSRDGSVLIDAIADSGNGNKLSYRRLDFEFLCLWISGKEKGNDICVCRRSNGENFVSVSKNCPF